MGAQELLESLTPGGSEFAGDPEACIEYIEYARSSKEQIIRHLVRERNGLAQELAALRALLAGAPDLLELAAELALAAGMAQCGRCPARDRCPAFDDPDIEQWPCYKAPAALRELARELVKAGVGQEERE